MLPEESTFVSFVMSAWRSLIVVGPAAMPASEKSFLLYISNKVCTAIGMA